MNLIRSLFSWTTALRDEYRSFFNSAVVNVQAVSKVQQSYQRLMANKARYEAVANALKMPGVPWYLIGVIHMRESTYNFTRHLHNGDPLTARTRKVPAGRPVANPAAGVGKPYTWEESAIDAIRYMVSVSPPWTRGTNDSSVESLLHKIEAFNGGAYRTRNLPSPYLWADSNLQRPGKFVADGKFDPQVTDTQLGAGVLLKYFLEQEAKKKS